MLVQWRKNWLVVLEPFPLLHMSSIHCSILFPNLFSFKWLNKIFIRVRLFQGEVYTYIWGIHLCICKTICYLSILLRHSLFIQQYYYHVGHAFLLIQFTRIILTFILLLLLIIILRAIIILFLVAPANSAKVDNNLLSKVSQTLAQWYLKLCFF